MSLVSNSFKLLCLTGFVYQMTHISLTYFAFKTNTKITLQHDNKLPHHSIVFCTLYTDLLDRTNYERYGIHKSRSFNFTEILSDHTKLTISDIFDLTPDPNNTMTGCQIRENSYDVQTYPLDKCYSLFQVTKYHEGMFICYQFEAKIADNKFKCDEAALSYHSITELYVITLHQRFLSSNLIKLISFLPGKVNESLINFPLSARKFYEYLERYGTKAPETSNDNYIRIASDMYSITRLQKPFDTDCVEDFEKSEAVCRRKCNIALFEKHNIFPPNEVSVKPLPVQHLNSLTLKNQSLIQDLKTGDEKCMIECNKKSCNDWYSVTTAKTLPYIFNQTLTVISSCSKRPMTIIQYLPRITLMEFVMFISSSLGIWFGVSVLSINPFANRNKKLDKQSRFKTMLHDHTPFFRINALEITMQEFNNRLRQLENK